MISRADFNAYNEAVATLTREASGIAENQILAWTQINPSASIAEIREFAKDTMDGLCQVYSEAAASLAAEWYDTQANAAHVKLPSAITETTYDKKQIDKVARYQATKLAKGDLQGFAQMCGEYVENNVKQSLNNTIIANAARDKEQGVRFARVPTGFETCAFCYMLASRGAVYHSRYTAGEQNHYHRRCDCKIVPGFENDPDAAIVEGYDPKGIRERMRMIENQTGLRFDNKADMSALSHEMKLRNRQWLLDGTTPKYDSYESEEAKAFKYQTKQSTAQHEKELRTAKRIAEYGFDTTFAIDVITVDGKQVGLADLKSGLEIKTLQTASSYNTIDNHLRDTSRKQNVVAVIFDNYECDLSDNTLIKWILESRRFKKGTVYVYDHNGNIKKIR